MDVDFADRVKAHTKRVSEFKDVVMSEEGSKLALIVPFLKLLGYDPNDPRVVVPEYCANFGNKKDCKVDFAIKRGDEIVMILESKKVGSPLEGAHEAQLQQYFQSLLSVKIAILTDGVVYKIFSDLDNTNVMDKRPFMVFDFSSVDLSLVPKLEKLCNANFDINTTLLEAQEMKYLGQLKDEIAREMESPSDSLVRHFVKCVYDHNVTMSVVNEFRPRVKEAFDNYIGSVIKSRLENVIDQTSHTPPVPDATEKAPTVAKEYEIILGNKQVGGIETTPQEVEGYFVVRSIVSNVIDPERVFARDTQSYCSIVLDNSNRKPICRLYFNDPNNLQIEIVGRDRKGTIHKLSKVSDIYDHADALRSMVGSYVSDL